MSDLTPIHDGEGEHYAREFFRREFVAQRLGRPGQWQGELASKLRLENPVAPRVFGSLLKGITPEGDKWVSRSPLDKPRVQGWRFSLVPNEGVSLLYGLSPELLRGRFRLVQNEAVRTALKDFEHTLSATSWLNRPFLPPAKEALFAKFQSTVSRERLPELATTVFLFNLIYRRGGGVEEYQPQQLAQLMERAQFLYQRTFDQTLIRHFGDKVALPGKLYSELRAAMPNESIYSRRAAREQGQGGEQLFAAWQERARELGWGSEKVAGLLREAKLRPTWRNYAEQLRRAFRYEITSNQHSARKVFEVMTRKSPSQSPAKADSQTQASDQPKALAKEKAQESKQSEQPKAQDKYDGYLH